MTLFMPEFRIVLVEPKIEGNVGAVARAMENFSFDRLVLVNPCPLTEESVRRSKKGKGVLARATTYDSLETALKDVDLVVGSSAVDTKSERKFARISMTPREFSDKAKEVEGKIAILFGREDYGLFNEELKKCDILLKIPSNPQYPVLNISHAASIIMYEIFQNQAEPSERREASGQEKEKLYSYFKELLDEISYPEHKKERTIIMFRRMMGRSRPSKWEFHALMGVISRSLYKLRRN